MQQQNELNEYLNQDHDQNSAPKKVIQVKELLKNNSNRDSVLRGGNKFRQNSKQFETIQAQPTLFNKEIGNNNGRFRMRSRTPNTNAKLNTNPSNMLINDSPPSKQGITQKSSIDYLGNSNLSIGIGGAHRKLISKANAMSKAQTIASTASIQRSNTKQSTITPGPGHYMLKPAFPNGPKYVIQTKTRIDSMFLTNIAQNISPGPAKYSTISKFGGLINPTIGNSIRFLNLENSSSKGTIQKMAGPGQYETNHVKYLRNNPRVTIGNQRRKLTEVNQFVPAPNQYNYHWKMTERRSTSAQRNAPSATFGNEQKNIRLNRNPTPGPQNYNTIQKKEIGDEGSVKVHFTTAVRPISARPGQIKHIQIPGPQDYNVVSTDLYRRRTCIVPQMSFPTAGKDPEVPSKSQERAKSPGPNHYRVQSAVLLKRNPSATFGNTRREIAEKDSEKKRLQSPGPSDYRISRDINQGPKYVFAKKYPKGAEVIPGPSDYNFNTIVFKKKEPRITIGNSKKVSCLIPKDNFPGPSHYSPNRDIWRRRASVVIFTKEKRKGVV